MGDTEIRRTMRIVFNAVELVRDAYKTPTPKSAPQLESAGQALWEIQGYLVDDAIERHHRRLRHLSGKLKLSSKALRPANREISEALADSADAVGAVAQISQLSIEAGLVG